METKSENSFWHSLNGLVKGCISRITSTCYIKYRENFQYFSFREERLKKVNFGPFLYGSIKKMFFLPSLAWKTSNRFRFLGDEYSLHYFIVQLKESWSWISIPVIKIVLALVRVTDNLQIHFLK